MILGESIIIALKVNLIMNLLFSQHFFSNVLVTLLLLHQVNEYLKQDYILSPNWHNTTG